MVINQLIDLYRGSITHFSSKAWRFSGWLRLLLQPAVQKGPQSGDGRVLDRVKAWDAWKTWNRTCTSGAQSLTFHPKPEGSLAGCGCCCSQLFKKDHTNLLYLKHGLPEMGPWSWRDMGLQHENCSVQNCRESWWQSPQPVIHSVWDAIRKGGYCNFLQVDL